MANEYLENELQELQAAVSCGCAPAVVRSSEAGTGSREESASKLNSDAA